MWWAIGIFCLVLCGSNTLGQDEARGGKSLSLFNLVKFDNIMCKGTKRNGTCYTNEECKDRNGKAEGTCAEGFGVCCIIELACGKSSFDNNTFLANSNVKAGTGCSYTICPSASSICRIRYDFTENTLVAPVAVTNRFNADGAGISPGATGTCTTDSMSISNSGAASSPVICGANKGQHMILDSDGDGCQEVVFQIGAKSDSTRKWDIHVTQFTCNDMDQTKSGPKGCLQYFTGDTGNMRSFNFPDETTVNKHSSNNIKTPTNWVHLANQDYNICVKQNPTKKRICYTPIGNAAIDNSGTYGISRETAATAKAEAVVDTACLTDYLEFPSGVGFSTSATAATVIDVFRVCGRFLGSTKTVDKNETACSTRAPYVIHVNFDGDEYGGIGTNKNKKAHLADNEHITLKKGAPGTIGFMFKFAQT